MDLPLPSFEDRCRALYPVLYRRVLWIVGDRDLAEDVLQEAMVKGYQARGQLREDERLEGWLHRIAVREAQAAVRARKTRWGRTVEMEEDLASGDPDPAEVAEIAEQRRALWAQLESLSAQQRTAFVFCAVEKFEIREAAVCMGISTGAVKRHLGRAREKLRKKLARYFGG